MNKTFRKAMTVMITVFMLFTSGCSEEAKVARLQKNAEALMEKSDFAGAVDVYREALNKGISLEVLLPLIEDAYVKWSADALQRSGGSLDSTLEVIDKMIREFPESKDDAANAILAYARTFMNNAGDDPQRLRTIWETLIKKYPDSDKICYGVDDLFNEQTDSLMKTHTDELLNTDLISSFEKDDFEGIFAAFDDFRKYCFTMLLSRPQVFPYVKSLDNGKTLIIEYVHTFFTMYYGDVDSEGKRNGEGRTAVYAVNEKEPEKYVRDYYHGTFVNNMLSGNFEQIYHGVFGKETRATMKGLMFENKYEGTITSHYESGSVIKDYTFTFNDGLAKSLGRLVNYEGDYYGVAVDNSGAEPFYYGYSKDSLKTPRGFYPYYRTLY